MKEDFLHFLWKNKLFNQEDLLTHQGEAIHIKSFGQHNFDAGPDFSEAKVKIGDTTWAGNVEIHVNSSDWIKHCHNEDEAYDIVILHVVHHHDAEIERKDGSIIPTLELTGRFDRELFNRYTELMAQKLWIPCAAQFETVSEFKVKSWLNRMIIERLEQRTDGIQQRLLLNANDWEETFYQLLARNFGMKVNNDAFEQLASTLPNKILGKHKNNLFQIEALIYGQAGFLSAILQDEYPRELQKEFKFLLGKYGLQPMSAHVWKFLRLRPPNFPTIRLAQLAALAFQSNHLFSTILEITELKNLKDLFRVEASEYFHNHLQFDKSAKSSVRKLGNSAIDNLLINVVVPILFVYGRKKNLPEFENRAFHFLENLKAEKNTIIEKWRETGYSAKSAFGSQALLQLKNCYCEKKRCLSCSIGNEILRTRNPSFE